MPNYRLSSFINCPYDEDYYDLLKITIFILIYFEIEPRLSMQNSNCQKSRLEHIFELIDICDISIHDLSRVECTDDRLPRLNMAYELGFTYGRKYGEKYQLLVLDSDKYRYKRMLSDLSGIDIRAYNPKDPNDLFEVIRDWLSESNLISGLICSPNVLSDTFNIEFQTWLIEYATNTLGYTRESYYKKIKIPDFIKLVEEWKDRRSEKV